MNFRRISIGNTTSLMADILVIDRAQSELIYGSRSEEHTSELQSR